MVPKVFFAWKVPAQTWTTFWALEIAVSILQGAPNHLDSGFHSIVDYLLEAVGMRLGFYFIGVEGGVPVGNNTVKYWNIS